MKYVLMYIGVISINMFFIGVSLVGVEYNGLNESNIYVLYCITIALMNIILFINIVLKKQIQIVKKDLILIIGLPMFLMINMISTKIIFSYVEGFAINYYLKYFLLWSYPSILIGMYFAKSNIINEIYKYIDYFIVIGTIAILKTSVNQIVSKSNFVGIGGATYQTLSYIAAFIYGLNLYSIFNGNKYTRSRFCQGNMYRVISFLFLFIQIFTVLISGGRGGIILVLTYSLYILTTKVKVINYKSIVKSIILIFICIFIGSITLPKMNENKVFRTSIERGFAFISDKGRINWKGTSGRDIVYGNAINVIKENMILGKGLFLTKSNPHNLFLEILINGGIIFFLFVLIIIIKLTIKMKKIIKLDDRNRIIFVIAIYPIVMLMFSGTYLTNTELWFCISFIISYSIKKQKVLKEII